jgi:hypothetical protein
LRALPSTLSAILRRFFEARETHDPIGMPRLMEALSAFDTKEARVALDSVRYLQDQESVRYVVSLMLRKDPVRFFLRPRKREPHPGRIEVVVTGPPPIETMTYEPTRRTIESLVELLSVERLGWSAQVVLAALSGDELDEKTVAEHARHPQDCSISDGELAQARWQSRLANEAAPLWKRVDGLHCSSQLSKLIRWGRLGEWHGLPNSCAQAAAELAYGPSGTGPDGVALLDGTLTAFRRFPAREAAPAGVLFWLRDHAIVGVEINEPRLDEGYATGLGEPALKERSNPGARGHEHLIYPSQGLLLHVLPATRRIFLITGYSPCTLSAFRALPWGRDAAHYEKRTH